VALQLVGQVDGEVGGVDTLGRQQFHGRGPVLQQPGMIGPVLCGLRAPHDINDSWDRIEAWLRTNAPTTNEHIGVPARTDEIPPVVTLVGEPSPDDLIAWWRRSCGTTNFFAARLLTGYARTRHDQTPHPEPPRNMINLSYVAYPPRARRG
jgi:hypothetical protein